MNKILPPSESFLYELFNQEEGQKQEEQFLLKFINTNDFDKIDKEQIKKFESRTNYIEDVVSGKKQVYFFDIPRLGSQFGAKFSIHDFLNEQTFDSFQIQLDEYKQKKLENENYQQRIEEEYVEKLQQFEPESQEYQDMMQEKQEKMEQIEQVDQPVPKGQIKEYLVVFDNLGQDKYFNQQDIDQMRKYCLFLENKWNEKNYNLILQNIQSYKQINSQFDLEKFMEEEEEILNQFGDFDKNFMEQNDQDQNDEKEEQQDQKEEQQDQNDDQQDQEKQNEQNQEDIEQVKEEEQFNQQQYVEEIILRLGIQEEQNKFIDYYLQEFKFKKYLEQYEKYNQQIEELIKLKFIKYSEIFQQAMYLMNKQKNDINFENTNIFDWRQFQTKGFTELNQLLKEYQYEGLKQNEYLSYNKVDQIQTKLDKIDEEKLKEFSYFMYIFLRVLKNLLNLRVQNILKRQKEFQIYNQIRERQLQQTELREEKKKSELKIAKEEFYASIDNQEEEQEEEEVQEEENQNPEEVQEQQKQTVTFNEEEWENKWVQENPEIEIPKELEMQIDTDMTDQFFEELQKNDNQSQQFIQRNIPCQNYDFLKYFPFSYYLYVRNESTTNKFRFLLLISQSSLHYPSQNLIRLDILSWLHLNKK